MIEPACGYRAAAQVPDARIPGDREAEFSRGTRVPLSSYSTVPRRNPD